MPECGLLNCCGPRFCGSGLECLAKSGPCGVEFELSSGGLEGQSRPCGVELWLCNQVRAGGMEV